MKKLLAILLTAILLLSLAACGAKSAVTVDLGESELYTEEELKAAADLVEKTISEFEGAKIDLKSLTYLGDARSINDLEYVFGLDRGDFDQCAVFGSEFHTSKDATGAWEPDTDYTWEFTLARLGGGDWTVVDWGY